MSPSIRNRDSEPTLRDFVICNHQPDAVLPSCSAVPLLIGLLYPWQPGVEQVELIDAGEDGKDGCINVANHCKRMAWRPFHWLVVGCDALGVINLQSVVVCKDGVIMSRLATA